MDYVRNLHYELFNEKAYSTLYAFVVFAKKTIAYAFIGIAEGNSFRYFKKTIKIA
jgi:hypothetical protein